MGRPQRSDPEMGWHHVMNRGAARREVFFGARDGNQFLRLVAEGCDANNIEVHAYCLMSNHYHLLLHCPDGGLSTFMHRLGSMYTRFLNQRFDTDGPIFRGRFRSLPVDTPEYLDCAARYIHRNPLDIQPPVRLDSYRWSSFGAYVGAAVQPSWLHTNVLIDAHGARHNYREFVEGPVAPGTNSLDWAIDTALADADDLASAATPYVRRAVAVAMLDQSVDVNRQLESWLGYSTADARRRAIVRSRKRVSRDPVVSTIAAQALRLAS